MISLKMLSTAAALALVATSASYAEGPKVGRGGPAFHANVGGGAPTMRMGGAAPTARFAPSAPSQSFAAARPTGGVAWNGGRTTWNGGAGGAWNGGYRHRDHDGRWWPGAVAAGAVIGGAIAANDAYAYYGGPAYYDQPAYYDDDQYVDDGAVAVVPVPAGEDSAAYCAQRYRSYDPASGTYLGFDGLRHSCP
jgi:hypothetical protein